jgi:hypothetical protein
VESTTEGVTAKVLLPTALVEPLPRAVRPREISDVERRPALGAGATAGIGARAEFARGGGSGAASSTAVIDVPAATSPADDATEDETQPLDTGLRRRERTTGRRASRRGLQIDLRDADADGPSADEPVTPSLDRDGESDGEKSVRGGHQDPEPRDEHGVEGADGGPATPAIVDRDASGEPERDGATGQQAPVDDDSSTVTGAVPAEAEVRPRRPVIEVRRRASKRGGTNGRPGSDADEGPAVLRTERPIAQPVPEAVATADAAMSERAGTTTTSEIVEDDRVDDDGVALTASEREARAARDRLERFQRAVQQGRAESKSRHSGGELHDA